MINWMYTLGIALFILGFRYPIFYNLAGGWFIGLTIAQMLYSEKTQN